MVLHVTTDMGLRSTPEHNARPTCSLQRLSSCWHLQQVLPKGEIPHTRHVRGSNYVLIGVFEDRLPGRAIVICVIDNLVKVGVHMQQPDFVIVWPVTGWCRVVEFHSAAPCARPSGEGNMRSLHCKHTTVRQHAALYGGDCSVQGASGQALQNMNLCLGLPEETGLLQQAMFP